MSTPTGFRLRRTVPILLCACLLNAAPARALLIAVDYDTGDFYSIVETTAEISPIGNVDIGEANFGALEYNTFDEAFYAMSVGSDPKLYRLTIGPGGIEIMTQGGLGVFLYEGGLAFSPADSAFAVNGGFNRPYVLDIDLESGAATPLAQTADRHDFAGLGWRSDGLLVGIDSTENAMYTVDPATAEVQLITPLQPTLGSVGGMVIVDEIGYFVTAGPGGDSGGSGGTNELWVFDPFTGDHNVVGNFNNTIGGTGLSGLAFIPEPGSILLLAGGVLLLRRRRN